MPVLIQLAEHEVEVRRLRKLLQRVRRLDHPGVGRGGVEAALGTGGGGEGDRRDRRRRAEMLGGPESGAALIPVK